MSDFNNSKRVKLSSVESGIKPEDEDEAFAVEQKQPIAGCSHSAERKTSEDASETATPTATPDTSKSSDLVEDVLMLIFETDFLDTADLLHCRLVNLCWRDCATSVLLRSSACQISLDILWVPIPSTVKFSATKGIYINNNNSGALLADLNEIISQSPKFPCSNFRFVSSYSFGDDHALLKHKIDNSSLHNFFSIYGQNVKTIIVSDCIVKSDLCSLLLNYAPCLECLDLQSLMAFRNRDRYMFEEPLFPASVILPNLKTLILGTCIGFNLIELIDAAINLQSVETTRVADLKLLLDRGKVKLIKKLECCLHLHDLEELSVFEKLADCQLKLTKLIVTAVRRTFAKSDHELPGSFLKTQVFLNRILESSKDTLKYLEFRICPFGDIKFPVLKNLECLKLVQPSDHGRYRWSTSASSSPMVLPVDLVDENQLAERMEDPNFEVSNEVDARISGRCPNRPCDSFPNLQKVQLHMHDYDVERYSSLIFLHTCRSHNRNIVPHVYKTVKVLEICYTLPESVLSAKSVSSLFPNVTILKVKCTHVLLLLNCSLWVLSPLAKSIEIYGLCNTDHHFDEEDGDGRSSDDIYAGIPEVVVVDSFFTGFSIEMCKQLKRLKEIQTEMEGIPSLMDFKRQPSICDLKYLTDFKIIFSKLRAPFASHVTGFYAFRHMPKTKITFALSAPIKFYEAECEMEKYLAPISSYIHFAHKNIPKRFDNDGDDDSESDDDNETDSDSDNDSDHDIDMDNDYEYDGGFW